MLIFIAGDRIAKGCPSSLGSVKGSLICKYWERTQRILQAYMEGAIFGDADYREKVHRSHCRV